jgi:hypothetical protein
MNDLDIINKFCSTKRVRLSSKESDSIWKILTNLDPDEEKDSLHIYERIYHYNGKTYSVLWENGVIKPTIEMIVQQELPKILSEDEVISIARKAGFLTGVMNYPGTSCAIVKPMVGDNCIVELTNALQLAFEMGKKNEQT